MRDGLIDIIITSTIPNVVSLIAVHFNLDELAATELFYQSKTYSFFNDQKTGFWHYSPIVLFDIFSEEYVNNNIVVPEGAC